MMRETGVVIKIQKNEALVSVKRKSSCGENCAMCKGVCKTPSHEALAVNSIDAKVGDVVLVETETKDVLKSAFLVYIVPVLLMFVSYILLSDTGFAIVLSILTFLSGCIIVRIFDKKLAPKTYITEIIDNKEV